MSNTPRRMGMPLVVASTLVLAAGCAAPTEDSTAPGSQAEEPAARAGAAPSPSRTEAETAFAMYLNDPANRDAWQWVCTAAAGDIGPAQYIVATRYRDGLPPVKRDLARAFLWFSAADRNGLVAAALERETVGRQLPEELARSIDERAATVGEKDCAAPAG